MRPLALGNLAARGLGAFSKSDGCGYQRVFIPSGGRAAYSPAAFDTPGAGAGAGGEVPRAVIPRRASIALNNPSVEAKFFFNCSWLRRGSKYAAKGACGQQQTAGQIGAMP
jgi:hypothetical protein